MGRAFEELGWEVISLDVDPKANPTILADVCSWEPLPRFAPGYFDMIWASPVCTEYSRVLTRRPRRLEEGDRLVLRTLQIINDLQPRFWAMENPATGLLKLRPFMAGLPWRDVSYCTYGYPYRKLTRIWGNLDWVPEQPVCGVGGYRCEQSKSLGRHPEVAQRGSFRRSGKVIQNCHTQDQLYSIPPALCREIASAVNARIVTLP